MATTVVRTNAANEAVRGGLPNGTSRVPTEVRNVSSRSDEEILGLVDMPKADSSNGKDLLENGIEENSSSEGADPAEKSDSGRLEKDEADNLEQFLMADPELRQAWEDAREYRKMFATPEDARNATALLNDVKRMDALFFSGRAEDHAELARSIAALSPTAFASLATAIAAEVDKQARGDAGNGATGTSSDVRPEQRNGKASEASENQESIRREAPYDRDAFYQSTNAAAVQAVVDAIQIQVERLLPEGASKTTQNRVVGEIYRELDRTLGENRQLAQQVRDAMQSGALDASQQRAIVSLISGRARQALPGVAKKVMDEWTSTMLAADRGRRARQRAAEQRVDIVGSGGAARDGRRGTSARDIDYSRLSDSDILNL